MEVSSLATFGIYLILAFILPGFCYLFLIWACFHDIAVQVMLSVLPHEQHQQKQHQGTEFPTVFLLWSLAVVVGLMVSSVTFASEIMLRHFEFFRNWFPDIHTAAIAQMETAGRGSFFLYVLAGSAYMHFNIGAGTLLILVSYLLYYLLKKNTDRLCWRLLVSVILLVLAIANLRVSAEMYRRSEAAIVQALKSATAATSDRAVEHK